MHKTITGDTPEWLVRDRTSSQVSNMFAISPTKSRALVPMGHSEYTVGTLPGVENVTVGALVYVSDETGREVPAFSDETNWRRMADRTVVT